MDSGLWKSFGLLLLILLQGSCYAEKAPYASFAKDATSAPSVVHHDYIIIGGGTSGCAIAATLSQSANVLLLERGGLPYDYPTINTVTGFADTLADTSPSSPSQLFISTDGVVNHRARVLGGGSALNAGFFTKASTNYVKKAGWDPKLVNESYAWAESKVAFEPKVLGWQSAVRDGLLEAGVLPNNGFTFEHLYGTKIGGSIFDEQGHRHTAADLLEYADPSRITVYLHSTVYQILFATNGEPRPKAYGVEFSDGNGKNHIAYLNKGAMNEVILSAGAIGSPQLLMLSGIGPSEHLKANGINVVLDKPMVGQGMCDNPMNIVAVPSPVPVEVSLIEVVGITRFGSFIEAASGSFNLDWIQKVARQLQMSLNQTGQNLKFPTNQHTPQSISQFQSPSLDVGIILEKIIGPLSTGTLELLSTDPTENPKVTFNYFQDPRDLERCVKGMETIIKVIESKPFAKYRYPNTSVQELINFMVYLPVNLRPRNLISTLSLEQYCKDTVMTIWHYHGGCQVGRVVDRDYRVIGVDGLRVIDGSTFVASPGTNPQATVMMLGRYMGQIILQERNKHGRK